MDNPINKSLYLPKAAKVLKVIEENSQTRTFEVAFPSRDALNSPAFLPGQFMMVSMPHCGEAPISISSSPSRSGSIDLSVRRAGRLTSAMHQLSAGDAVGLRGPYGRPFPIDDLVGYDLLFVAGGIGLAPLRAVIQNCLEDERFSNSRFNILFGAKDPAELIFKDDLKAWQRDGRVNCRLTVDQAEPGWSGSVGLVTELLKDLDPEPKSSRALVCGPPRMIRAVLSELSRQGFADEAILTTLERHMKCGVGVCRHCHLDSKLVCKDGPVFSLAQLRDLKVMELAN